MKKTLVFGLALVSVSGLAFALNLSVGAGIGADFSAWPDFKGDLSGSSVEIRQEVMPVDLKVFFDAAYLQASIGYMFVNGGGITTVVDGTATSASLTGHLSYVSFSLYGKIPFSVGLFKFFPLLGIEYKLNLTYTDGSGNDLKSGLSSQAQSDLNEIWFEAGMGGDISLRKLYIRPELLLGFKPLSTTDNNALASLQGTGYTSTSYTYFTINVELLIGYKF